MHIGLILNPLAGLGGSLARKGSDGRAMRELAQTLAPEQLTRAEDRAVRALQPLLEQRNNVRFSTWVGDMGERVFARSGIAAQVFGERNASMSDRGDTVAAARTLCAQGVDLLLFVGGDGTARDIFDAVGAGQPVLGVPAGVKMHSGVFAVSPEAAGELLLRLIEGGLVALRNAEVRDIDEAALREEVVRTRFYGEMQVPAEGGYLQHTKVAGREDAELVAAEIAQWLAETMEEGVTYLLGPGSTTSAIKQELGIEGTLVGVDAVRDGQLLAADADEAMLLQVVQEAPGPVYIVVTAIGGQGHIFGRGNQQFSPAVIAAVGVDNIIIVAAKSKITGLQGRPLLVDTNDPALDVIMAGYRRVITGYDDQILYRVGAD